MLKVLLIFTGSGLGGVTRWLLSSGVQRAAGGAFPWGTLAVNMAGCFAIGLMAAVLAGRDPVSDEYRLALFVGLLGGFTTFSAFGFETYELLTAGRLPLAALNVAVQIAGGLAAVWLGQRLGSAWV